MTGNIQNKTGKTFVVLAPDKIKIIAADQMMRFKNRIHRYQQVVKSSRQQILLHPGRHRDISQNQRLQFSFGRDIAIGKHEYVFTAILYDRCRPLDIKNFSILAAYMNQLLVSASPATDRIRTAIDIFPCICNQIVCRHGQQFRFAITKRLHTVRIDFQNPSGFYINKQNRLIRLLHHRPVTFFIFPQCLFHPSAGGAILKHSHDVFAIIAKNRHAG